MQLPKQMVPYIYGILHLKKSLAMTTLEFFINRSHDSLTRALNKRYAWKEFLQAFIDEIKEGYLVIDDTDINKKYAKKIIGIRSLFSHKDRTYFSGYSLLLALWVTTSGLKIPVGFKIYSKNTKKTQIELTIELLHSTLFILKLKPRYVLFDSFFASKKILYYCQRNNVQFFGQLPSNRLLNRQAVQTILPDKTDWCRSGYLKGGIFVKVVKHGKKYFFTSMTSLSGKKIREIYQKRWAIECFFRCCKSYYGLERCQAP